MVNQPLRFALIRPALSVVSALLLVSAAAKMPPSVADSAGEPIRYIGKDQPDKAYYDGRLPHAVGVHRYQAFRANRTAPLEGGQVGWTYNHAPMLAYWKGRFWLQYLSDVKEEHNPPGRTLVLSSADGRHWSAPEVAFPAISLPSVTPPPRYFGGEVLPAIPQGTQAIMHQRMGWYVAPNGRLLTVAFYSYCPDVRHGPNRGHGIGRVVREVHADGSFGPIHFIRYNREAGWDEANTPWFPSYKASPDAGFVAACEALLADKLMTLQWWEEDRQNDGFYALKLEPGVEPKAFNWYVRPDGVTVGVWKTHTALSPDGGQTWTRVVRMPTLWDVNGKIWAQRTADGRYALTHTQSATRRNRFPLVVVTGDDGRDFDHMLLVHGEVSPMRYHGINKNYGPQYIRGLIAGNGDPGDGRLWLTYSMNKEDLWVTSLRVPITGQASDANDNFEGLASAADLAEWNLHVPLWAPVQIAADPLNPANHALRLSDRDPYEYAKVERVFPARARVAVEFRMMLAQPGPGNLEIEVQGARGERPMRLRLDPEFIMFDHVRAEGPSLPTRANHWYAVRLEFDTARRSYDCIIDGTKVASGIPLQANVTELQRVEFRTGAWRQDVRPFMIDGEPGSPGVYQEDLPGADTAVAESVYYLDDVRTSALP
ncbi:MAG: hypothetical protein JNG83_13905 [Opitutaceae bacterium]|nr:hypothetical protein [Opitutaceae bacterium]